MKFKNLDWFDFFTGCLYVLLGFLTLAKFSQKMFGFLRPGGAELTDAEHEDRTDET